MSPPLFKTCLCVCVRMHVYEHVCVHIVKILEVHTQKFNSGGVLEDVLYFLFRLIYLFQRELGKGRGREKHKQTPHSAQCLRGRPI